MSLFKFCQTGKVLLKSPKQAEGSSQAPYKTDKGQPVAHKTAFLEEATLFDLEKEKNKKQKPNTCLLLLIGSNGSNVSCKATVAAFIDLWVKNASGDQAHSLLSILQQGGLHPLDLQDLGLDICRGTRKHGEKLPV